MMAELILEILDDLMEEEFKKFKFYLNEEVLEGCRPIPRGRLEGNSRIRVVILMKGSYGDRMVNITREILKKIQRNDLIEEFSLSSGAAGSDVSPEKMHQDMEPGSETEQEGTQKPQRAQEHLRSRLEREFECTFEGVAKSRKRTLNSICTELNITEGDCEGVSTGHEVWQIETASRKQRKEDTPINCNNIFKPLPGQETPIRTVLTKGISGIGKTISVKKFALDWATGEANQDVDFMFVLHFRELNLINDKQYSLLELLQLFYPETRGIENIELDDYKLVFILDGLEESRLPLNFQRNKILSDVTKVSSLDVLLTNLIKGNLLPSALLWITSQPAAANQIPPWYFHRLTEVKGFSDPQKEEYFRKRFSDQADLADRMISHVKTYRSLYIMCHIPLFCWISATVLEEMLCRADSGEIPKTLTGMYTHFLLIQSKYKNEKYAGRHETEMQKLLESDKEILLKLGQLAFQQLEKGNLVFYEEDLRECGINVTETSVYSGVCTEIFKQETVLYQKKVYSFVHLSLQEYLAALHVLDLFTHNKLNAFGSFLPFVPSELSLHDLHKKAIQKALENKNGHLDLFLRFLLGLSLDSNQSLLQGLLKRTGSTSESIKETVKYIKVFNEKDSSPERCINLFHCLSELNDDSLEKEVQQYLSSGEEISPAHCSALAYMLLMSEKVLDEFDLSKSNTSAEGLRRVVPVVKHCRKAVNNNLGDSGVKLLCAALSELHTLRLGQCNLTEGCCDALASVLRSHHSELRELELRDNDLQDSGVRALSAGLEDPHCKLQRLGLSGCGVTQTGCASLASALHSNPSHLRELDLSYNHPGDSGVTTLSAGLEDPSCKLERLLVDHGGEIRIKPGLRKYACQLTLDPNTAHRELVGVYLDWPAGTLSFYSISSDRLTHLHTFHTTFTEPLYPGFGLGLGASIVAGMGDTGGRASDSSVTQTEGFERRRCGSCETLMDSTQWYLVEPSTFRENGICSYRFTCRPGCYECSESGLRWVCEAEVTLQYRYGSWEDHKSLQHSLHFTEGGPLLDITVTAGQLKEIHLPHFICLGDDLKMFMFIHRPDY
ncbi:hypothetical protein AAFF_G00255030 [Aldrovandia affinis]|uniref:NACHT, LRR and PYD domains-containing protein 12-like n=1 Tax=Aldrovandia affinis TaxID=143900 RepID=A0AAD7RCZ8_9TELE|nr:hypothetical protein AAFF_G00255030 [Aldrovandia affinis]